MTAKGFTSQDRTALQSRLIGCEIRRRRTAAGLTLTQLARAAGLSASYLSEVERGKKTASLTRMTQIAKGLGVSCVALLPPSDASLAAPGLPARLRSARDRLDLTQEQLAMRARVSPGLVAQIESGTTQPSLATLERLAAALEISPCFLLAEGSDLLRVVAALPPAIRQLLTQPDALALLNAAAALDQRQLRKLTEYAEKALPGS